MEAYKFDITVQENGVIQIPEISGLANREVEVLIMVKPQDTSETAPLQTFDAFLKKWSGIIKNEVDFAHSTLTIHTPETFLSKVASG